MEPKDAATACWCCGSELPASDLTRLGCHPEVGLCDGCVGRLAEQRGNRHDLRGVAPIFVTGDLDAASARYRALGFEVHTWEGGGYGVARRGAVEFDLGERPGLDPATNTAACYLDVADADELYAEWSAAHVAGQLDATIDTNYGMREGRYVDPDGNTIRFGSPQPPARFDGLLLAPTDPLARP